MIMCVLLCYPVSIHMSQLLSTGCPISSFYNDSATILQLHVNKMIPFKTQVKESESSL